MTSKITHLVAALMIVLLCGIGFAVVAIHDVSPISPTEEWTTDRRGIEGFGTWTPSTGDANECKLHSIPLREDVVRIEYGAPGFLKDEVQSMFPHANRYIIGGCVREAGAPVFARVRYCQQCRRAEWEWYAGRLGAESLGWTVEKK